MDASSRVLSELAAREQALDAKIESARQAAAEQVRAAEAQAAALLREAEGRAQELSREQARSLEAEVGQIRAEASAQAQAQAQVTRDLAQTKLEQATLSIMRAVLP